jgi:hypothetical protein
LNYSLKYTTFVIESIRPQRTGNNFRFTPLAFAKRAVRMSGRTLRHIVIALIILRFSLPGANAQREVAENLETFLYRPYYFGFLLGFNSMDFVVHPEKVIYPNDSLFTLNSYPDFGFQIGILANKRINNHVHLRLATVLAFGERTLNYRIRHADTTYINTKQVESTFIEFPLSMKITSMRLNNFSAYVLGGTRYGIDLASQAKKKEQTEDVIVKLLPSEFSFDLGVGFDFYLPYFKFGIELKRSFGVNDLLVREQNIFTNDIRKLNSKIYQLSFTFEG